MCICKHLYKVLYNSADPLWSHKHTALPADRFAFIVSKGLVLHLTRPSLLTISSPCIPEPLTHLQMSVSDLVVASRVSESPPTCSSACACLCNPSCGAQSWQTERSYPQLTSLCPVCPAVSSRFRPIKSPFVFKVLLLALAFN